MGRDNRARWEPFLNTPIRGAAIFWERIELGPARLSDGATVKPAKAVDVPTALRLNFEAGPVWFVAAIPQPPDMEASFLPGDEIMVVFSSDKRRGLGFEDPASVPRPLIGIMPVIGVGD